MNIGNYFDQIADEFDSYYHQPNSFFDGLINTWLRKPGLMKRMKIALEITNPRKGISILDIGCGSGQYVVQCAKAGANVTGIDISPEMIKLAKKHCKQHGVMADLRVGDIFEPLPTGYDVICSLGVLEYFPNADEILNSMLKALKSNGIAIFSVPKLFAFQMPLRNIMLARKGIKSYYYTKKSIIKLAGKCSIYDVGPGYIVKKIKE